MNISNLVFNSNNTKLEDLINIKEFQTKEDLINKLGIDLTNCKTTDIEGNSRDIFFTESEFKEKNKWLNINLENIYYNSKCFGFINAILYIDIDKFIIFDLSNYLLLGKDNTLLPSCGVSGLVEDLEEKYNNKNYSSLLFAAPDSFKLQLLELLVNSTKVIDEQLYNIFMDYYTTTDFGFNSLSNDTMTKIFNNKSENLKSQTNEKLSKFSDKITVYRGQADKSTNYKEAYSWSLSPNIATFFSLRHIENKGKIVTGVIDKSDIIEYFDNTEQEVLVLPNKVKDTKVYDFYTINTINKKTKDIFEIFGNYKYILNNYLDFKYDSREHGKLHSLRVLLNALILGKLKGLNEYDLNILAMASIYHDIGRENDEVDNSHGIKSCEIFEDSDFNINDIAKFLIQYHCIDDNVAIEILEKSDIKDKNKAKKLFYIFKDADALDRLRFGIDDLDFTCLRNKEAIRMILFSYRAVKYIKL